MLNFLRLQVSFMRFIKTVCTFCHAEGSRSTRQSARGAAGQRSRDALCPSFVGNGDDTSHSTSQRKLNPKP